MDEVLSNRRLEEILSGVLASDDASGVGELLVDFVCEISLAKEQSVEDWAVTAAIMESALHDHAVSAKREAEMEA